jgi:hypothetical protein
LSSLQAATARTWPWASRRCFRTKPPFTRWRRALNIHSESCEPPWNAFPTRFRQRCRILVRGLRKAAIDAFISSGSVPALQIPPERNR